VAGFTGLSDEKGPPAGRTEGYLSGFRASSRAVPRLGRVAGIVKVMSAACRRLAGSGVNGPVKNAKGVQRQKAGANPGRDK